MTFSILRQHRVWIPAGIPGPRTLHGTVGMHTMSFLAGRPSDHEIVVLYGVNCACRNCVATASTAYYHPDLPVGRSAMALRTLIVSAKVLPFNLTQ